MIRWTVEKIFGTKNQRQISKLTPLVKQINEIESSLQTLSDDEIKAKTTEFKQRLSEGETLDDILPEAYAVVKNVCRRLVGSSWNVCGREMRWDMVPFDVQLMGAIVLHQGKIAEMATGEGKTLVATMPLYLNALTGRNCHLITVNDYLALRDSEWMGRIYTFLGLTVGCIQNQMNTAERQKNYTCDITYGTNSEFGFDYLRDNGQTSLKNKAQQGHYFVIIDEVDSILIDEARTPLIISGQVAVSTHKYKEMKPLVAELVKKQTMLCGRILKEAQEALKAGDEDHAGNLFYQLRLGMPKNKQIMKLMEQPDIRKLMEKKEQDFSKDDRKAMLYEMKEDLFYAIEEKHHDVFLTEKGRDALNPSDPEEYVLPDIVSQIQQIEEDESLSHDEKEKKKQETNKHFEETSEKVHNIAQLLKAYSLFEKDIEYVVQDNQVLIVDEFTGRLMPGRRYSDGLHQAIEAKENVAIERETQTLATITIQNYFRMYDKLSGMTGTAETEANEFFDIYKLDVGVMPTNAPVRRIDYDDVIYKTKREKFNAVIEEIIRFNKEGQPVLVGTISVDVSEVLSRLLKRRGIKHEVLNAKNHHREAEIIALAGQPGSVTIATNMAGRGTDIKLGKGVVRCEKCCIKCTDNCAECPKKEKLHCEKDVPCGLHVLGTERHESRRIDRQLRGRSGRQGDPGSSRFFISLEDDLMRLFGSERIAAIMTKLGVEEGEPLMHPLLSRSIERAQRKVEERNFNIRKHLLKYDDVMNKQREVIYSFRNQILADDKLEENARDVAAEILEAKIDEYFPERFDDEWDFGAFSQWFQTTFLVMPTPRRDRTDKDLIKEDAIQCMDRAFEQKKGFEGEDNFKRLIKYVFLDVIDHNWKDHLYSMDQLRESIYFQTGGQKDQFVEYSREGYTLFEELMETIKAQFAERFFHHSIAALTVKEFFDKTSAAQFDHDSMDAFDMVPAQPPLGIGVPHEQEGARMVAAGQSPFTRSAEKVGRNDPCPCGSGKKFKKCCGS